MKELKKIGKRSNCDIDPIQLERDVMASNISEMITELEQELTIGKSGSGGGHSSRKMSEENIEDIKDMFDVADPFSKSRDKVVYKQKMQSIEGGDGLMYQNTSRFLARRKSKYLVARMRRNF